MPELLTAVEAAALLRVDVRRVQTLARLGRLPAVRAGRRWLFDRDELLATLGGSGGSSASVAPQGFKPNASTPSARSESGTSTGFGTDRSTLPVTDEATRAPGVDLSARNQMTGVVRQIVVDGLMAEVLINIGDQELVAVITRTSAERLGLRAGANVLAVIKSTEIMVAIRTTPESNE